MMAYTECTCLVHALHHVLLQLVATPGLLASTGKPFRADVALLQCSNPPAVSLKIFLPTGQPFLEETINQTDTVTALGLQARVTLDHYDGAIGIQVIMMIVLHQVPPPPPSSPQL